MHRYWIVMLVMVVGTAGAPSAAPPSAPASTMPVMSESSPLVMRPSTVYPPAASEGMVEPS